MTLREIEAILDKLESAPDGLAVPLLAAELRASALSCPWLDAEHVRRIDAALHRRGIAPDPSLAHKPLRVGETFLLLHLVAQNSSSIAKVRATSSVPQNPFTADTLIEIDRAKRALLHAAGRACRALPETVVASAFDVVLPGELDIEGGSLGLSVCVALASRALDIPPSQDVAASAATRSDGTLLPVLHLPAKLAALSRSWPGVTTVVVAAAQEVPPGIPFEV